MYNMDCNLLHRRDVKFYKFKDKTKVSETFQQRQEEVVVRVQTRQIRETRQGSVGCNGGLAKMKRIKSSEVIPLRPHVSDAKARTESVHCLA